MRRTLIGDAMRREEPAQTTFSSLWRYPVFFALVGWNESRLRLLSRIGSCRWACGEVLAAAKYENIFTKIMRFRHGAQFTTKEPTADMLEVAIASFNLAMSEPKEAMEAVRKNRKRRRIRRRQPKVAAGMNIAGAIEYLSAGLSPVTDEHLTEARLAVSDMAEIPYNRLNKYNASTFPAALMPRLEELVSRRKSGEPPAVHTGQMGVYGAALLHAALRADTRGRIPRHCARRRCR